VNVHVDERGNVLVNLAGTRKPRSHERSSDGRHIRVTETMEYGQFQARLDSENDGKVRFSEYGQHGWTGLEEMPDRLVHGKTGPHWADAAPIPRGQWLLGRYDFETRQATFFYPLERCCFTEDGGVSTRCEWWTTNVQMGRAWCEEHAYGVPHQGGKI
jgi:hypothetical protein